MNFQKGDFLMKREPPEKAWTGVITSVTEGNLHVELISGAENHPINSFDVSPSNVIEWLNDERGKVQYLPVSGNE